MKQTWKRILATLLVAVMVFGVAPAGLMKASAYHTVFGITDSKTINTALALIDKQNLGSATKDVKNYIKHFIYNSSFCAVNGGKFPYPNRDVKKYGYYYSIKDNKYSVSISGGMGCNAYSRFVQKVIYGSDVGSNYYLKKSGAKVSASGLKTAIQAEAQAGEHIQMTTNNAPGGGNHSVTFVSCDNNGFYYLNYAQQYIKMCYSTWEKFAATCNSKNDKVYLHDISKKSNVIVTLTAAEPREVTMSSAKIWADLSCTISVEKESYVISTRESDISGRDYTQDANRKWIDDNSFTYGDYIKFQDWGSGLKSIKASSWTVNSLNGKPLTPGTTYYYKMLVKDGSGKWYSSQTRSFKTLANKPGKTTLKIGAGFADIGINDVAAVNWAAAKDAASYELKLYNSANNLVFSSGNVTGTTYAFPGKCFAQAGTYYATLTAKNAAGTVEAEGRPTITVHPNVNVTFYDTVAEQAIQTISVVYGHNAPAPQNPAQTGYTFKGWSGNYTAVKANTTVNTVYEANTYNVNFVDGMTGQILKTQKVKYKFSATPPESAQLPVHNGYEFVGWDRDYREILGDTTISTSYKWYNENYQLVTTLKSVTNNKDKNGYDFELEIKNGTDQTVQGRAVLALKTQDGYLFTNTESYAFSLSGGETKTIKGFVPSDKHAVFGEVYTINNYENAGPLARPATLAVNNDNAWTAWIETENESEIPAGAEKAAVEGKTVTYYKYKTRIQSYETSMPGYRQVGEPTLVKTGSGTVQYVKKWNAGFDKTSSFYSKYANKTPVKASESATAKTVINSDKVTSYIYWHWCRGTYTSGPINRKICDEKTSEYKNFHAFETTTSYTDETFKSSHSDVCKDTYWWWGASRRIEVYTQTYTTYKKLYTYELITGDDEGWTTETPAQRGITNPDLYESKIITTNPHWKYRTNQLDYPAVPANAETGLQNLGAVDASLYGGREATIFIYKYTQASDFTTEYVFPATIDEDGEITVEQSVKLREALNADVGDYAIVASVEGYTAAVPVGVIEAPKKLHTVKFFDYDRETVLQQITVEEGGSVTAPDPAGLHLPEGEEFNYWSLSTIGVYSDLAVYPETRKKNCVVVFIDWNSQTYEMREMEYGDEIVLPSLESEVYTESYWITDDVEKDESGALIATDNMVITSNYRDREIKTVFLSPEAAEAINQTLPENQQEGISVAVTPVLQEMPLLQNGANEEMLQREVADQIQSYVETIAAEEAEVTVTDEAAQALEDALADGLTIEVQSGEMPISIPELEEDDADPKYLFYGWKSISTGRFLTEAVTEMDDVYLPVYSFAKTCEIPEVSVETGEYAADQTISFTCETENAQIWYTVDYNGQGIDPRTSDDAIAYFDENGNPQPFTLTKSAVVTYYAGALGMNDSELTTKLYAINKTGTKYHIVNIYSTAGSMDEMNVFEMLIKHNELLDIPDDLINATGFTFDGLYYDDAYEDEFYPDEDRIGESLDLYAKHTAHTYSVVFLDYDGRVLSEQTVSYGEEAEAPATTRDGYVFTGWSDDGYLCATENGEYTAQYCAESEYITLKFKRFSSVGKVNGSYDLGKRLVISPAELGDSQISWYTSNSEVATVDYNGVVSFVGIGTVTVTAVAEVNGERVEASFEVEGDDTMLVTLSSNATYHLDSAQFIREVPAQTTVATAREQFTNGEYLTFIKENADGTTEVLPEDTVIGTGVQVVLYEEDSETKLDSKQIIVTGDFDGDGKITAQDASHVSRYLVEKETAELWQLVAADCNGDGKVNVRDASMIARYTVGKEIW